METERLHEELSWRSAVARDEAEEYPAAALSALRSAGWWEAHIPAALGGAFGDLPLTMRRIQALARRDVTVAVACLQILLGSLPIWISGSPDQQRRHAARLRQGIAGGLALTERAHGADLLRSAVTARLVPGGYQLDGEKWLINNASRGGFLSAWARTLPAGGLRGFSLFLLDKAEIPPDQLRCLDKIKTHGIRGADISGVRLDRCLLSSGALIGPEGGGLPTALRTLHVNRSLCAGLSLGAADAALRVTARFARSRPIYGATVLDIPHPRRTLAEAFARLLACQLVAEHDLALAHAAPERLISVAPILKHFIPTEIEAIFADLAPILGARHYLRAEYEHGIFQKMMRDVAVVSLFDGAGPINLHSLAQQLPTLLRPSSPDQAAAHLHAILSPRAPFDHAAQALQATLPDPALAALPTLPPAAAPSLLQRAAALADEVSRAPTGDARTAAAFKLARRYEALHSTALLAHAAQADPLLSAALCLVTERWGGPPAEERALAAAESTLLEELTRRIDADRCLDLAASPEDLSWPT